MVGRNTWLPRIDLSRLTQFTLSELVSLLLNFIKKIVQTEIWKLIYVQYIESVTVFSIRMGGHYGSGQCKLEMITISLITFEFQNQGQLRLFSSVV